MIEALSDVLLLTFWVAAPVLFVLAWLAVAWGLALLIGRAVRARDRQVPVELTDTQEQAFFRSLPTDTVLLERVRP